MQHTICRTLANLWTTREGKVMHRNKPLCPTNTPLQIPETLERQAYCATVSCYHCNRSATFAATKSLIFAADLFLFLSFPIVGAKCIEKNPNLCIKRQPKVVSIERHICWSSEGTCEIVTEMLGHRDAHTSEGTRMSLLLRLSQVLSPTERSPSVLLLFPSSSSITNTSEGPFCGNLVQGKHWWWAP
jgi:hypothetical protein